MLVQTPESLNARFNLDVRPFHEVTAISSENKTVTIKNEEGSFEESYDKLILSPGAKPLIPEMSGLAEATNVYSLRNVPDLDHIMTALEHKPAKATVIGAGFIGLEMAENLKSRGLEVTVIERAPHVLPPLDEEMAAFVQNELVRNDIRVITGESAQSFSDQGKKITLTNGEEVASDLTILSVGVRPENTLAQQAGLATGLGGGIVVDETYQTSAPDIYAVGDAIVVKQQVSGEDALISLASPANRQGRQVADVIAGLARTNRGSIGTAIVRVFELAAASTGLSERVVKQLGLNYQVVHVSGKDHAGYYPGASDVTLKLVFEPKTGKIYGAQGVGAKGVDKRIDILATAIKGGLTIFDLPELEFTYAPPFGSAKDPINMLGYAAINLAEGISDSIQWYQLKEEQKNGSQLLDVRNPGELANGRFPEAINLPLNQLRERISELDPTKNYVVSCHSGLRSYVAERLLKQKGFNVKNLDGAFALYKTVRPEELIYE